MRADLSRSDEEGGPLDPADTGSAPPTPPAPQGRGGRGGRGGGGPEGRPLVSLSCNNLETKNVAWKLPLPAYSGSTPIIWGNTIFLNVATAANTGDARTVGHRSRQADRGVETAARRHQPHGAQAEHVVAVAGHRRQALSG